MKVLTRLIAAFLLVFAGATTADAAWVKVFESHAASSDGDSVTTVSVNTTAVAPDFFVVVANANRSNAAFPAVTDSASNTWASLTSYDDPAFNVDVQIFYTTNYPANTSTTHTFTNNPSAGGTSAFPAIVVYGFTGARSSSVFDSGKDSGAGAGATTVQPGSLTPSENNCLLITAAGWIHVGTVTPSINGGFSTPIGDDQGVGSNWGLAGSYLIQTSATAANPTWTLTNANTVGVVAAMGVFRAQASGGATGRLLLLGVGGH